MNPANKVWTIDSVKKELPIVPVILGKHEFLGKISGRKNQFATVTINYPVGERLYPNSPPWIHYHFSWQTIVDVLNNGRKLKI